MKFSPYQKLAFGIIAILILFLVIVLINKFTQKKSPLVENTNISSEIQYKLVPTATGHDTYPVIINFPNKEVMDNANGIIADGFQDSGCLTSEIEDGTVTSDNEWNVKRTVTRNSNDVFSLTEEGNFFCGGPHPENDYLNTLTIDMKTGKEVNLESFFTDYKRDKLKIEKQIFTKEISSSNKNSKNDLDTCNSLEMLSQYDLRYRFGTTTGVIYLSPDYPHVIGACIVEKAVQVFDLGPYLAVDSVLRRI